MNDNDGQILVVSPEHPANDGELRELLRRIAQPDPMEILFPFLILLRGSPGAIPKGVQEVIDGMSREMREDMDKLLKIIKEESDAMDCVWDPVNGVWIKVPYEEG